MDFDSDEKPRLVPAGQGFSALNTVQYKGRFLYSKYNPERAVLQTVDALTVLPQTLVIICSPGLWYGLPQLLSKCTGGSEAVAFEADRNLLCMSAETPHEGNVALYGTDGLTSLDAMVREKLLHGSFRRAIRIDFSAGVQFAMPLYAEVAAACEDIIASFWKNRLTLTRLGRLFAKNVLDNVEQFSHGLTLGQAARTVENPILVCGAGESLEGTAKALKKNTGSLFVLAVDAALPCLAGFGITPHAVVALESQLAIQQAYHGFKGSGITLFADASSRPQIPRILGGRTVWFLTEYAQAHFLEDMGSAFFGGRTEPPLGSVGLAALRIALLLRKSRDVPVYVTGLDFAFSAGRTHARGAPAHSALLRSCTRLTGTEAFAPAFSPQSTAVTSKDGSVMYSTPAMLLYAKMFREQFGNERNVMDAGKTGCPLSLPQVSAESVAKAALSPCGSPPEKTAQALSALPPGTKENEVRAFYRRELTALRALRDLLSNGESAASRDASESLEGQIKKILERREYLYLHFPDGYKPGTDTAFLKRVRAELDPHIRRMEAALRRLS